MVIDHLVFNFIRPSSLCSAVCQLARPQQQGLGCSFSGHAKDAGRRVHGCCHGGSQDHDQPPPRAQPSSYRSARLGPRGGKGVVE